ncbi:hypothetical protein [Bradyrhizobium icense]|uniref:Uncharacterized protein n=1 Tax=Bradyrhizobium icense TaxID=1274631 RepID=A0A1B1UM57_9BRAD|nr:hypothetical protein [Bradyrhizobium icense]ANW03840.1 hypothetical protein LMTR13_30550 [Bradyrhizobium icense]
MKKLGYVIAALGALVIAAPSIASAETVVIKKRGYHGGYHVGPHHRHHGARAEFRRHRGWHRGHHHGHRTVVIKKKYRY